jgi:hypothetical protein
MFRVISWIDLFAQQRQINKLTETAADKALEYLLGRATVP